MFETCVDVWSQTVAMLAHACTGQEEPARTRGDERRPSAVANVQEWAQPTVRVLERSSAHTLTVSWCDSRTGHYGHQTWQERIAKRTGTCVLSGRSIAAGDHVYSPQVRGSPPPNAQAMIIASYVDDCPVA
ncbi:DUF3331 domain-containing protein [Paraburkholderia sp.]|uniref:DUF3331 domain-containing protein n=1 Tax=Paraburkholderia sp. TaxID=1926495 RepID=UPI002F4223D0